MKTKKCKYCKTEIDATAKVCPNCKRNLKGYGCLILFMVIILFSLCIVIAVGVNSSKENTKTTYQSSIADNSSNTDTSKNSSDTPDIFRIGDTTTIGDWEITLNSIDILDRIDGDYGSHFSPEEGSKYIKTDVTIKNISANSSTFLPVVYNGNDVKVKLTYNDNYEFSGTNLLGNQDDLHLATLNPLSSKTGIIVFEVADEAADLETLKLVLSNNKTNITYSLIQ